MCLSLPFFFSLWERWVPLHPILHYFLQWELGLYFQWFLSLLDLSYLKYEIKKKQNNILYLCLLFTVLSLFFPIKINTCLHLLSPLHTSPDSFIWLLPWVFTEIVLAIITNNVFITKANAYCFICIPCNLFCFIDNYSLFLGYLSAVLFWPGSLLSFHL